MVGEGMILRVQDEMGRGPYKPGLSSRWIDPDRVSGPPSIFEEVENFQQELARWHRRGYHIGCAVHGPAGLKVWFTKTEMRRMLDLGYGVYDFTKADRVINTAVQLIVASKIAFRKFPKVTFDINEIYESEGPIWTT